MLISSEYYKPPVWTVNVMEVYMKRIVLIASIMAALSLLVAGCGGGGDPKDTDKPLLGVPVEPTDAWWLATDDTGERKFPGNIKELIGEDDDSAYVHVFFRNSGLGLATNLWRHFQITIEFELENDLDEGSDIMWQCAYDGYGTWSRRSDSSDYVNMFFPGAEEPIVVWPEYQFPGGNWDDDKKGNGKTKLDVNLINGICIQIPLEYLEERGTFKLTNVKFGNVNMLNNAPVNPPITGPHPLEE